MVTGQFANKATRGRKDYTTEQHLLRIRPISSLYLSTYLLPRVEISRNWTYDFRVSVR